MQKKPKNTTRILFVHQNNDNIGGADFCLFKLVQAINNTPGYSCRVVLAQDTDIVRHYKKEAIPVEIQPLIAFEKSMRFLFVFPYAFLRNLMIVSSLIKKHQIDLVHSNDLFDVMANIAASINKKPSCQHIRTILSANKFSTRLIIWLCKRFSTRILCVSNAVKDLFSPCDQQCVVMHDWLDFKAVQHDRVPTSIRADLELPHDAFIVVNLGRLVPWKGQELLLDIVDDFVDKFPDTYFLIAGQAPSDKPNHAKKLFDLHRTLKHQRHVYFLGHRQDIVSILKNADILVSTSLTPDPLPGVIMEAQACRRIIVGPDAGGIPEEIEPNKTGFLYRQGDREDFLSKLERARKIARNPQMGLAAEHFVKKKFNKKSLLSLQLFIYRQLLSEDIHMDIPR